LENLTEIVTNVVLGLIAFILLTGFYQRIIRSKSNKIIIFLPSAAVSLGILGTFIGIYLGLREFDVSNINDSIPNLLEGLKTAFTTSIAGMITSIILKFLFECKAVSEDSKEGVQQDDPVELLKMIVSGIIKLEKSSKEVEKSIVSCLRSDEEYSLISQLKLIRQEIIDSRKDINNSLKEFSEKIAESSTDAIVKALEDVISQFNVLLNELVSESFKELSTAMIKLTEWQDKYKNHIDGTESTIQSLVLHMNQTVEILGKSSNKISSIEGSLVSIDGSVSNLTVSAEDISQHVESLGHQNETLKQGIISIKNIGEEAKTVLPEITKQIDSLTKNLESTVLTVSEKMKSSSENINEFVEKSISEIEKATTMHTASIQDSIEEIDKGLEKELSKALNSLAGNLASLSAKFVEDYQPLTDRLREVVRLAEKSDV